LRPVKRRLSMILRGTTPRALSWPAFLILLALGALLPLRPTWAVPETTDEPPAQAAEAELPIAQVPEKPAPPPAEVPVQNWSRVPATGLRKSSEPVWTADTVWTTKQAQNDAAVRKQQLDEAQYDVELAEVQVGLKKSELREAQANVQRAKRSLE